MPDSASDALESAGVVEIPLDGPPSDEPPSDEPVLDGPTADSSEPGEDMTAALLRIDDRLAESQRLMNRQADIAAKLHAENLVLRGGELRAAQTALVTSVIRVHDDVVQMALTTEDGDRRRDLELVSEALVEALDRNGVEAIAPDPGEPFDSGRHRIAEVRETGAAEQDRTVAAVLRAGFAWADGTTVRLTDVAVHKHVPLATGDADHQTD